MTGMPEFLELLSGAGDRLAKMVLDNGREFDWAPLPEDVPTGPLKQCFKNALEACWQVPGLVYVEGYASTQSWGMPVHHAWVLNPDGLAVDPTWHRNADVTYLGVPLALAYVERRVHERGYYGALSWDAPLDVTQILPDLGRPVAA